MTRIHGAAISTTGSITAHDSSSDRSQWLANVPAEKNGMLAIAAAIEHVSPD